MDEYFAKYQYNVALAIRAETQLPPADHGWICVIRFYAALHLMNSYLVKKRNVVFDPKSSAHPQRQQAMHKCPELRDAPTRYRQLKDLSESVRYDAGFKYSQTHHANAKAHLDKIVAIIDCTF